ncbi:glycosyltransferase family 2 protein [Fusobacterium sp. MFO224]|uniref:glycosyltransferase family 2 protein n=1 Tax=Fusobacterium sp. MFO224 TaxID=3378070 RepID=UPI003852462C
MGSEKLVSIIIPMYNSEKHIEETIQSVLNQSYKNFEILIIDDLSRDNSREIVKKYMDLDTRIKLIENETNMGVSYSRNLAISLAKGKYVAFLDSDDLWNEDKLAKQIKFMEERNIRFTYTNYRKISENGEKRGVIEVPERVNYKELLKGNIIGCLTVVIRKDLIEKYKFMDTKQEDYILWLEILKEIPFAYGIREELARYRVLKSSRSSNKIKMSLFNWNIYRKIEGLSLCKSIYLYLIYLKRGFNRYLK